MSPDRSNRSPEKPRSMDNPPLPPVDPRRLRLLFARWEPERPELLIRLRPRVVEVLHGAR